MGKTGIWVGALLATVGLSGCMTAMAPKPSRALTDAVAVLHDAAGKERGVAKIEHAGPSTRVTVRATGLPPGAHGLHIHAIGRCDAPDFATAGPHWNPEMKQHGRDNPLGAHRGDLPNLMVDADGRGSVGFDLPDGAASMLDADGAAIVVHAGADDYRTDPSGNSGARIACGVFEAR